MQVKDTYITRKRDLHPMRKRPINSLFHTSLLPMSLFHISLLCMSLLACPKELESSMYHMSKRPIYVTYVSFWHVFFTCVSFTYVSFTCVSFSISNVCLLCMSLLALCMSLLACPKELESSMYHKSKRPMYSHIGSLEYNIERLFCIYDIAYDVERLFLHIV